MVQMQFIVLVARLLLAGIFAIAGFAKLSDRAGTRKALIDFGIPEPLAQPGGIVLPFLELAVAIALLPVPSAWFGAIGALGLLTVFSLAIAFNLARGRRPECNCFGQLQSEPIGWSTLMRNVALGAVASLVVWQSSFYPGLSFVQWLGDLTNEERIEVVGATLGLCLLTAMVTLTVQLLRQQGRLLLRLDSLEARLFGSNTLAPADTAAESMVGLPIGTRAPSFALDTVDGKPMTLDEIVSIGKPTLLLFTNPNCGPCDSLMPEVEQWQQRYSRSLTIALVSEGSREDIKAKVGSRGLRPVLCQREREVAEAYQAWGTPAALLVGHDGAIASFVAQGADRIRALVTQTVGGLSMMGSSPPMAPSTQGNGEGHDGHGFIQPSAAKLGEKAPSLLLPDLSGKPREVASLRGRSTLLLFWNPNCGFCQQMLNDLKAFDEAPSVDSPELLLISSGTPEDGRAMKLRAPILLDRDSRAATAFGAGGTPMAILLDARGHIASEVAAGAQAVLALAKGAGAQH